MGISDYSTTASSNSSISGIDISEGCAPGNINGAIRQLLADIAADFESGRPNTKFNVRNVASATLAAALPEDTTFFMGELLYIRRTGGTACDDLGIANIDPAGLEVTPEHFGAANTGEASDGDDAPFISKAMLFCHQQFGTVKKVLTLKTSGWYYINSTFGPSEAEGSIGQGRMHWDSGDTTFRCEDVTAAGLRKIKENPQGTSVAVDSTKGVIFNTRRMEQCWHTGNVHFFVAVPPNMRLENKSLIPVDVVAMAAAEGISPRNRWGRLRFSGCYHPFWQGDHRGTGTRNLSYTGMSIEFMEEFMCGPIVGGQGGNMFDDVGIEQWTRLRCFGTTIIRIGTMRVGGWFNNGKNQNRTNSGNGADSELVSVTTTGGSTTINLSGALDIPVGMKIGIRGADMNLAGTINPANTDPDATDAIFFMGQIASKTSDTEYELDRPVPRGVANSELICDLSDMVVESGDLIFGEIYAEEIHYCPIRVRFNGRVTGNLRWSQGEWGAVYGVGMIVESHTHARVDIGLHSRSANNPNLRYNVGVASLRNSSTQEYNAVGVNVRSGYSRAAHDKSKLVSIIQLVDSDIFPGFENANFGASNPASSLYNPELNLVSHYADVTVQQQSHSEGADAYSRGGDGNVEYSYEASRGSFNIGDLVSRRGNVADTAPTLTKTAGADGGATFNVTGGLRYMFIVGFESFTSGAPTLAFFDGGGVVISDVRVIATWTGSRVKMHIDVPASAATVELQGFQSSVWVCNEFTGAVVIDR